MRVSHIRPGTSVSMPSPARVSSDAKREIVDFVKTVAWFLLIFVLIQAFVFEIYEVEGASMDPTLKDKERILVFKLPHVLSQSGWFNGIEAFKPGDVIVFDGPDESQNRYIKRVVAKGPKLETGNKVSAGKLGESAGERVLVQIKDGQLYVNNRKAEENYLPSVTQEPFLASEREDSKLRAGEYFVLGDNRRPSKDSRTFGPVDDRRVIGKAVLRFWPLGKFGVIR